MYILKEQFVIFFFFFFAENIYAELRVKERKALRISVLIKG